MILAALHIVMALRMDAITRLGKQMVGLKTLSLIHEEIIHAKEVPQGKESKIRPLQFALVDTLLTSLMKI